MTLGIGEYALIGDGETAALVGTNGSIDWLCLPHFDSPAAFCALLGTSEHGRWRIGPMGESRTLRRYLPGTLILETTHVTPTGTVRVTDFMPTCDVDDRVDVVRIIDGVTGEVEMEQELIVRFGYGDIMPWMRQITEGDETLLQAIAGPDRLQLHGSPLPVSKDYTHHGTFTVKEGDHVTYDLIWQPSYDEPASALDADDALANSVKHSHEWLEGMTYEGPYLDSVQTSLLVLRALTDSRTGGILAAPTTSLPETLGGERNWDYRFTWLRDASLTVDAINAVGLAHRADQWREWLLRAIAGEPDKMLIMYRRDGGREMIERELDHLPGYAGSTPVRVGNGAWDQRQNDVLGQVLITLSKLRETDLGIDENAWKLQRSLVNDLANNLDAPDHGLWEMRGDLQHFTHSRAMMWAAFDRSIRAVEEHGLPGDASEWRKHRDALREEVLTRGFCEETGSFRQHYETDEVDASLLTLPDIGIIEATDERFLGTIEKIERDLMEGGMPLRYRTAGDEVAVDGLMGDEHPFLLCGFWMVIAYAQAGRLDAAGKLMNLLVSAQNDVGLLAEEYDTERNELMGNYPQAFSHLGLVLAAVELAKHGI